MTHRFPYDEKEHAASKQTIQDALTVMHQNDIPFQWVEEDGSSLLGCYASLRYGSLLSTDRKSLRHESSRSLSPICQVAWAGAEQTNTHIP